LFGFGCEGLAEAKEALEKALAMCPDVPQKREQVIVNTVLAFLRC